ncbi:MAG: 23S rRNA (adenine(2503)-C(2))-methyltransferase RlmN [Oscillospiraceae bacterium]|nr:23S rRNA (adenine(2503)-C(2))-methyltransferase RlmN [Oscillospiraceae bacterium]
MNTNNSKINILNMTIGELSALLAGIGEPSYRAEQIFTWLHKGVDIGGMSNLSKKLREYLFENAYVDKLKIAQKLTSSDGTVKYVFELGDDELIESVFMRYNHGTSLCLSSQVGCRMGCKFCASTLHGLKRNLEPSEMLGQILAAQKDTGERVDGLVLMGVGEPLDNYANVVKFLRLVNCEQGLNIGYRHISLSTCGLVEKIKQLANEDMAITLSVSLHASDDKERAALMPSANKWSLGELLDACVYYFKKTGRRISFEYTLIDGVNDSVQHAERLARLLPKTMPCHVNLIPVNKIAERTYNKSPNVIQFNSTLNRLGINSTVRRSLGADINASCGQLRNVMK